MGCVVQRRAGPKGFGLFTKQDLKAGQFVIEYVGEVRFRPEIQCTSAHIKDFYCLDF